jgi:Skp family chaperone for outer membrane proteins
MVSVARAQQAAAHSGFLILSQERILTGSNAGQKLLDEEVAARDTLRVEARATDRAFAEEERELTELRAEMEPDEFRTRADDFDARVVRARRDQDERSTALAREFDRKRRQFYASVAPVLVALMDRYGASAIFDETSVLLTDQSVNITEAVIAEIDALAQANAVSPEAQDE